MLEKGADADARGGVYGSALETAACEGNEKIVEVLLENMEESGRHDDSALKARSM